MPLGLAVVTGEPARAQFMTLVGAGTIALKSNETLDLGEVYFVSNCRSLLTATPTVEVLDGPADVAVAIREESILPRRQNCAKKVKGGVLTVSAKEIDDPSYTRLTVRILYKTKNGDRKFGHVFNLQLLP